MWGHECTPPPPPRYFYLSPVCLRINKEIGSWFRMGNNDFINTTTHAKTCTRKNREAKAGLSKISENKNCWLLYSYICIAGGKIPKGRGGELKCYIQTYRPSDEAGPR